jgi:hypothetical protein
VLRSMEAGFKNATNRYLFKYHKSGISYTSYLVSIYTH